jgi:hypothetical protein
MDSEFLDMDRIITSEDANFFMAWQRMRLLAVKKVDSKLVSLRSVQAQACTIHNRVALLSRWRRG